MCFCFNDTATTEIYTYGHTLSLHDALPISATASDGSAASCTIRAGMPTTVAPGGTSLTTTEFEPTRASAPTVNGPRLLAPAPTTTRLPRDRTSVVSGQSLSLRVAIRGRPLIYKTTTLTHQSYLKPTTQTN